MALLGLVPTAVSPMMPLVSLGYAPVDKKVVCCLLAEHVVSFSSAIVVLHVVND